MIICTQAHFLPICITKKCSQSSNNK
uniref:Uncharacterized protein n=1 Tax=Arundo donax TaxID=35708 RepID=A0A0A9B3S6_ARUDO